MPNIRVMIYFISSASTAEVVIFRVFYLIFFPFCTTPREPATIVQYSNLAWLHALTLPRCLSCFAQNLYTYPPVQAQSSLHSTVGSFILQSHPLHGESVCSPSEAATAPPPPLYRFDTRSSRSRAHFWRTRTNES